VKAIISRIFLILIAFPVFYLIIFTMPWMFHIILNIFAVGAAGVGTAEVIGLFRKRDIGIYKGFALTAGIALPAGAYIDMLFFNRILPLESTLLIWLSIILIIIFLRSVFVRKKEEIPAVLENSAATVMAAIYPGFFIAYIIRISELQNASLLLFYFFSVVFVNDIMAYIAGLSIGRGTRMGLIISPKKSLVGFIFGFLGAVGISILYYYTIPGLFNIEIGGVIIIGSVFGIVGILGDLVESALKRSAEVKDSGEIIPGRGGLLDSIDSMLFVAPIFYYIFKISQKYLG